MECDHFRFEMDEWQLNTTSLLGNKAKRRSSIESVTSMISEAGSTIGNFFNNISTSLRNQFSRRNSTDENLRLIGNVDGFLCVPKWI